MSIFAIGLASAAIAAACVSPRTARAEDAKPAIEKIFSNMNGDAIASGPARAAVFVLPAPARIAKITTYHWNGGRGASPGTITMRGASGETLGSWPASGQAGQNSAPNVYWVVAPGLDLPAGTYTVVDSDPSTWSQNVATGGLGMLTVEGNRQAAGATTRRGCDVAVYWDPSYSGEMWRTSEDQSSAGPHWTKQISSLVVISGVWDFYGDGDYHGEVITLPPGAYPYVGDHWNKKIGSFRCVRAIE